MEQVTSYNERLFNRKIIRGKLHFARYIWLQEKVKQYHQSPKSVLELGCYDAKTIDFLPDNLEQYVGYDANWENGLDLAKTKYKDSRFSFFQTCSVNDFNPNNAIYDISICMETIEHLALNELEIFIKKLELSTNKYCFVTVPNEKGIVLIIKYLI
jgi:2-polyprenyl-3-methyl-5-hydroxy-6-metoxy-1,4-benzoquinol methylase